MEGVGEGGCGRDFHCFSIKYNMIICADGKSEAWYQLFVVGKEEEEEEEKNEFNGVKQPTPTTYVPSPIAITTLIHHHKIK
jgi:hypothetical protein